MLYAYAARFDVTKNLEKFLVLGSTKQGISVAIEWIECCHAEQQKDFRK